MSYETDAAFMLRVLRRGPATTMEIIEASIRERGCGLTPHSRNTDVKRLLLHSGETVECSIVGTRGRKAIYRYRIVPIQRTVDAATWREVMEGVAA